MLYRSFASPLGCTSPTPNISTAFLCRFDAHVRYLCRSGALPTYFRIVLTDVQGARM